MQLGGGLPAPNAFAIKRNLIVLSEPTPRADRVRATKELQTLHIKADLDDRRVYLDTPKGTRKVAFDLPARTLTSDQ